MKKTILLFTLLMTMAMSALGWTKKEPIRLWSDVDGVNRGISMTPYLPEHNDRGLAVVVCPGGSYFWLDPHNESSLVGQWLASNGIAAFVLRYSVGSIGGFITHWRAPFGGAVYPAPIEDLQRAFQIIRDNAHAYNVNPQRVGAMGFSAGGHLVVLSGELSHYNFLEPHGVKTSCSLAPDFIVAVYPVVTLSDNKLSHRRSRRGLLGEKNSRNAKMQDSLSLEKHVHASMPPVFITNCKDDPIVKYQNSQLLDNALSQAGVPHRYFLYEKGKHGYGASDKKGSPECREWKNEFLKWIFDLTE